MRDLEAETSLAPIAITSGLIKLRLFPPEPLRTVWAATLHFQKKASHTGRVRRCCACRAWIRHVSGYVGRSDALRWTARGQRYDCRFDWIWCWVLFYPIYLQRVRWNYFVGMWIKSGVVGLLWLAGGGSFRFHPPTAWVIFLHMRTFFSPPCSWIYLTDWTDFFFSTGLSSTCD